MLMPRRLAEYVETPGTAVMLEEALLLVASCRPGETRHPATGLALLDRMAAAVSSADADGVCRAVFGEHGFRGDEVDYHDPRNSLLDEVLARRTGIPITLAVVVIAVARRVGVELRPIGAPGHFLVLDARTGSFLDPFRGGARVPDKSIERARAAAPGGFDPFAVVDGRAVLSRVLNNLQNSYVSRDRAALDWMLDLRLQMPHELHGDPLVLTALCERRGRFDDAARLLVDLAERTGDDALMHRSTRLAARLN